jgi:subtilisin family serine protease
MVMLRLSPQHFQPNSGYGGDYGSQLTAAARRRLARQIARRNGLVFEADGWPMPLIGIDCYTMAVRPNDALEAVLARLSHDPEVAWAQPLNIYETRDGKSSKNDPLLPAQPAAKAWRLADLHRFSTGRGVRIAVVDSKIDVHHPDLEGQFVADEDFAPLRARAPERHGTGVAGIIAAKAGNGVGVAGVAPGARLMALRACWQGEGGSRAATLCDSLSLAKALHFAIEHSARVINLSLTGPQDRLLSQLLKVADRRGVAVVAAYDSQLPKGGFPASEPSVVAVSDQSSNVFPARVYGAPGQDVPTTVPGGQWNMVNGSSYSAAHVSGLFALVDQARAADPRAILAAAQPAGGVIDACAILARAIKNCCRCGPATLVARPAG